MIETELVQAATLQEGDYFAPYPWEGYDPEQFFTARKITYNYADGRVTIRIGWFRKIRIPGYAQVKLDVLGR